MGDGGHGEGRKPTELNPGHGPVGPGLGLGQVMDDGDRESAEPEELEEVGSSLPGHPEAREGVRHTGCLGEGHVTEQ